MKTITVVGLGSIGMRHARNLLSLGCKVYGVDNDPQKEQAFLKLGGSYTNDMLGNDKVDGYVIATPTPQHYFDIKHLALTGKPLFVEKPIADRMFAPPKNLIMVGNNLRFHRAVKSAKNVMQKWASAGIAPQWAVFVCAQFNDRPEYLRDGVVSNWGAHEIDLALYLLGPAKLVNAAVERQEAELILDHENGCRTVIRLDYVTQPEKRGFFIAGENFSCRENLVQGEDFWNENYIEEMQAFLDRIDGKETLGATAADGIAALKIILDAQSKPQMLH